MDYIKFLQTKKQKQYISYRKLEMITMQEEIWKPIKDFEGLYEISNLGIVRSLYNNIILKPSSNGRGWLKVGLHKKGQITQRYIHRLVGQAFIPNPGNLPEINHIDEDKTNNQVSNLEWCTSEYNLHYGNRMNKLKKAVLQFNKDGVLVKEWESGTLAYKQTNICHISDCCNGNRKSAGGYIWKYKDRQLQKQ